LRSALHAARESAEAGIRIDGANSREPVLSKSPLLSSAKMPAYVRASLPVRSAVEPHEADRKLLAQLATRIIQIEGPIHIEDIARRIAASFGRERAGSRISSATQEALKLAERLSSDILNQESFWLTRGQLESPPVRDRSADEGAPSKDPIFRYLN